MSFCDSSSGTSSILSPIRRTTAPQPALGELKAPEIRAAHPDRAVLAFDLVGTSPSLKVEAASRSGSGFEGGDALRRARPSTNHIPGRREIQRVSRPNQCCSATRAASCLDRNGAAGEEGHYRLSRGPNHLALSGRCHSLWNDFLARRRRLRLERLLAAGHRPLQPAAPWLRVSCPKPASCGPISPPAGNASHRHALATALEVHSRDALHDERPWPKVLCVALVETEDPHPRIRSDVTVQTLELTCTLLSPWRPAPGRAVGLIDTR